MIKRLFQACLILLLILLLLAGVCLFYVDPLLNEFIRPQIEKIATQQLAAEVQIGRLLWRDSGLDVRDLRFETAQQGKITIPSAKLGFSFASLRRRQLEALSIFGPQIEIYPQQGQESQQTPFTIPQQLPLSINELSVIDGRLSFFASDRQLLFRELNFKGALGPQVKFSLSALFGTDDRHPLELDGNIELNQQINLTLQHLLWQKRQLLTRPLQIKIAAPGVEFGRAEIHLAQIDQQQVQELLSHFAQPAMLPEQLVFSLTGSDISLNMLEQQVALDIQVAEGSLAWDKFSSNFHLLKLQLKQEQDGWRAVGQFQGPAETVISFNSRLDDQNQLSGQAQLRIPDPDRFKQKLIGGPGMKTSGGLQLQADYSLAGERFELTTEFHGQPPAASRADDLLVLSNLSGRGELRLSAGTENYSLDLQLDSQPFLTVNGNFQQLSFSLVGAELQILHKLLAPGQIPAQIQAATDFIVNGRLNHQGAEWLGTVELQIAELVLPELTLGQLSGRTGLKLVGSQFSFNDTSFAAALSQGERLQAKLMIRGAGKLSPQRFSLDLEQLDLSQVSYISADGQTGLGEAELKIGGNLNGAWPDGPIALDLNGSAAAAEFLTGAFYAELASYPANFSLRAVISPTIKTLQASSFSLEVPQLGTLSASGELNPEQISLQAHLALNDLATSYGERLGPLFSGLQPALAELTLEGALSLDGKLSWTPDSWQSTGILHLQGLDAFWERQQLKIAAGNGRIPFAIGSDKQPSTVDLSATHSGEISFGALSVGLASLAEGQLQLSAAHNRFIFRSPLALKLADGKVKIEDLNFAWPAATPQGSVKIVISQVNLQNLTEELGLPVMQGRLSADLGTIRYADRQLSTDGLARIEVFGGQFLLRNMRYSEPFSNYPTFHSDIVFSGLDLLQATRTFDFGEMNGILDGQIQGLQLFGTTPAAFEATVTTRNKGKRNISVKALNNLSILSQGGISSVLSRGIYRFIDFYRYRKIGFKCSLENDTFTLLGTALSGSNRYLVHGGLLPPRIDITTTTPTISFKEMLNRLGRIERAGN